MNRFWQLLITIRDFGYHWSVKQYDEERASSEYKNKVRVFLSGYIGTIVVIVFQVLFHFGLDPLPVEENSPWLMRLLAGGVIFLLPLFLVSRFLLKKVGHIPIPKAYSPQEYRKSQRAYWGGFLFGWFLVGSVGMFLMSYLREILA